MLYTIENNQISTTSVGIGFIYPGTDRKIFLGKHQFINPEGEQEEKFCFTDYGKLFANRTLARSFKRSFNKITDPDLVQNYTDLQIDFAEVKGLCNFLVAAEEPVEGQVSKAVKVNQPICQPA